MASQTASQTASLAPRRLSRDTGFPEPFHRGSNTTLPHPDANLSPDACISFQDLDGDQALKRKRLSFLHRPKHKQSLTHGRISPHTQLVGYVLSLPLAGSEDNAKESELPEALARASTSSARSKDGNESLESRTYEDTPPSSPGSVSSKKVRLFSKWA